MSGFAEALRFTLRWEGGKVDNRVDRGGRTAYGITQGLYTTCRKRKNLPEQDVWSITAEEVADIYLEEFWRPTGADSLPWPLSLVVFDAAVHSGPARAGRWVAAAIAAADETMERTRLVLEARRAFLNGIVRRDSQQGVFAKGWLRRVDALQKESGL